MTSLSEIAQSAFGIKRRLSENRLTASAGHSRELLSAALGLKSFASLQHAWEERFKNDFDQAFFVLDQQTFDHRALKLGYTPSPELNDFFLQAIQGEWRDRFSSNMIIEWEIGLALDQLSDIRDYPLDDHFSSEIASSNAIMDEAEIDPYVAILPYGPLPEFVDLNVGYNAHMDMLDDKPVTSFMEQYSDKGMSGELTARFVTTGFRGLIFLEVEGGNEY